MGKMVEMARAGMVIAVLGATACLAQNGPVVRIDAGAVRGGRLQRRA